MKSLVTLAMVAVFTAALSSATPAAAHEHEGYDVICVTPILPGGQPGPKVCVPVPI